jgi:hypothetical protein
MVGALGLNHLVAKVARHPWVKQRASRFPVGTITQQFVPYQ